MVMLPVSAILRTYLFSSINGEIFLGFISFSSNGLLFQFDTDREKDGIITEHTTI